MFVISNRISPFITPCLSRLSGSSFFVVVIVSEIKASPCCTISDVLIRKNTLKRNISSSRMRNPTFSMAPACKTIFNLFTSCAGYPYLPTSTCCQSASSSSTESTP